MAKSMKNEIKKPRGKAAAVVDDDDGIDETSLPSGDIIKALADTCREIDTKMATLRGQKGSEIKEAESAHNVHRGAMRDVLKLYKMAPEARDEYLRHRESYELQLGLGRQANLFDGSPAETATFAGRDA